MYGIRNCDTVKKARAWLEARGVAYEFHDYKLAGLDEARALALMVEYPSAIKRPVVEVDGRLLVGFNPELYSAQHWT